MRKSRSVLACALLIVYSLSAKEARHLHRAAYREPEVYACVLSDTFLNRTLLSSGEKTASEIYSTIGVRLRWDCSRITEISESLPPTIIIQVQAAPPAGSPNGALAFAMPFADHGVRITLLYARLKPVFDRYPEWRGSLLGHTLAHEIGHVLEGEDTHATTGLMRARWTDEDFDSMHAHLLGFTAEDASFIRKNLFARGNK